MKIIDLHCDTFLKLFKKEDNNLYKNDFHIDINKLKKGNSLAQFFAMFIYKEVDLQEYGVDSLFELATAMIDKFYEEISKYEEIEFAKNIEDLSKNEKNNKISAFLSIEEGGIIEKKMDRLEKLYNKGVRAITLTWNFPNSIGYPNNKKQYQNKGLTNFGKRVVKKMNEMGIIIDVSHLSDKGFFDVAEISEFPFVATHSNSRKKHNHRRNLTDKMIKKISESGGVIGINFCASFLADKEISEIADILSHINHIRDVGGIDVLAIGSDFDGISCNLEIQDYSHMQKLIKALKKNGYRYEEIEKISHKNAKRVIKQVL